MSYLIKSVFSLWKSLWLCLGNPGPNVGKKKVPGFLSYVRKMSGIVVKGCRAAIFCAT